MITRKCCCATSCCEDYLVDQFVTIFDTEMDSAVPVSQDDLIVLKINRPGAQQKFRSVALDTPFAGGGAGCPKCCRQCSRDGCLCGDPNNGLGGFDLGGKFLDESVGACIPCCCVFPSDMEGGCADSPLCNPNSPLTARPTVSTNNSNVPSLFKKITNKIIRTPQSYFEKYKIASLSTIQILSEDKLKAQKNNEKIKAEIRLDANSKNKEFKNSLTYLQLCKKCLIDNNIDIDCAYNNSPECAGTAAQMCEKCGDACNRECDPNYGGTETQFNNVNILLNNIEYTNNFVPLSKEQDTTSVYSGETPISSFMFPPDDGGGGGGGGGGGTTTPPIACGRCEFSNGNPPAPPIYFIYRYSYCNFVWYPPEWIFNYNIAPSQCAGYNTSRAIKTCDYLYGIANSSDGAGANQHVSCTASVFNFPSFDCPRDAGSYPCQCRAYPHLSGGLVDTVQRNYNFSQREFFGGFIPSRNPFLPKIKISEIGCCSCFTSSYTGPGLNECRTAEDFDNRRNRLSNYPFASGYGRGYQIYGINCTSPFANQEFYNPNYKRYCFNRGISPYLSRVAATKYVAAFDIMHYGSSVPDQQETLNAFYKSSQITDNGAQWTGLRFAKLYDKKSSLYHKLVGIISLEHHFESWAYHSKAPWSPAPPMLMNHCNVLLTPYERPYAGQATPCAFYWDSRSAMRWQIQRYTPRNVIYGSSGVPIFFSDLYAFEELSKRKGILIAGEEFDGGKFLEKFYLYFYNNSSKSGSVNEPLILPTDVADYEYVAECLKAMIKNNIISVKDHANDIRTELIEALDEITFEPGDDEELFPIFRTSFVRTQIGGREGYQYLVQFLKSLIGIGPDTFISLSNLKQLITVPVIKKLINKDSHKKGVPAQMFWGPRRVKLIPTPITSGLTAWGCFPGGCDTSDPSPLDVPNIPNEQYTNVFSGDRTSFSVSVSGKVLITGNEANKQPWLNNRGLDSDPNNFNESVAFIPDHLGIVQDLLENQGDAKDGRVVKVSSKSNFAVALVTYDNDIPVGLHQGNDGEGASLNALRLDANSGIESDDPNELNGIYHDNYSAFNTTDPTANVYGGTPSPGYRLKAWGPDVNIGIFCEDPFLNYTCPSSLYYDWDHPFPVKNRYKVWVDVAAGVKHCSAVTADGFLFDSAQSDIMVSAFTPPPKTSTVFGSQLLSFYKNLPKPDYFTKEEWNSFENWIGTHCGYGFSPPPRPCDIRCYLFSLDPIADLDYNVTDGSVIPYYGQVQKDKPIFTQVGAGHYHTIAVSSDQNITTYGKYFKVKPDGSILGPTEQDSTGNTGIVGIDVFSPISILSPDRWSLGGETMGCQGATVYTTATKQEASVQIFAVDGGPDYSMAILGGAGSPSTVAVWGHSEMVSALTNNQYAGLTAVATKTYDRVDKISAGANSFAVLYKNNNNSTKFMDIFVRPSKKEDSTYDFGFTEFPFIAYTYQDIALGYGHGIGIIDRGYKANAWNYESFNKITKHDTLQFKHPLGQQLPLYFRSQAFFRCVPGHWDMSKWLFGRTCNQVGAANAQNVILQQDKCSVYWRKNEKNLCYTGFPQYYWMRPTWRRYQQVTPLHTRDPGTDGCGLMRDSLGRDHMDEADDFGTGALNTLLYPANRELNTLIGGCYSGRGDICWVGDGSPSAYKYNSGGAQVGSGRKCVCEDPCGCPPESETLYQYRCDFEGVAVKCFEYNCGRAGFASNKDYFVQSHKNFGTVKAEGGKCCGVVDTNITYFYYAKRCYYYKYNKFTDLYEVNNAPLKYRTYYLGDKRDEPNPGATSATFINYTMTPEDAIPKTYQVDWFMDYPLVYCGGGALRELKLSIASSTTAYNSDCSCNFTCNTEEFCKGNCKCSASSSGCKIGNPGEKLLGPGGWIYNPGALCRADLEIPTTDREGFLTSSILHRNKTLYLNAGSGEWLGPLVEFGPYTGRLPPGFTASCYTGPNCPCPNYEANCNGCNLTCSVQAVYDVVREYTLDDLDIYNPPINRIEYSEENCKKLFRVYEELPSTYFIPGLTLGLTGAPLCFGGGVTDVPTIGCGNSDGQTDFFRAYVRDGQPYLIASDFNCSDFDRA